MKRVLLLAGVFGVFFLLTEPLKAQNPVPTITSIAPSYILAGDSTNPITINGTGFVPNSVIRWNGVNRFNVSFVSSTRITLNLQFFSGAQDLQLAGGALISVFNSAPGGGVSNDVFLRIVNAVPTLTGVSPSSVAAGSNAVDITLSGTGLTPFSVVRWNNTDMTSTSTGGGLRITVPAIELAAPQTALITVYNTGPGGGVSNPIAVPVYLPLRNNDFVYDPTSRNIFVSVPASAPAFANSLVPFNPEFGLVGPSLSVGTEPTRLALSDDGRYLYVGLNGNADAGIRRIDMANRTVGPRIDLGRSGSGVFVAGDIKVMPSNPLTIAVARHNSCCGTFAEGVAIYADGVQRQRVTASGSSPLYVEFSSNPTRLYGISGNSSSQFQRMNVDATGVTIADTMSLLTQSPFGMKFDNGLLYMNTGQIINPETRVQRGLLANAGPVLPDSTKNRLYAFQRDANFGRPRLFVYDQSRLVPLGVLDFASFSGFDIINNRTGLLRWGNNGLAFRGQQGIYILSETQIPPIGPGFTTTSVVNAASFRSGSISPGELVTIFGTNLGPPTLAGLELDADGLVTTAVAGTRVFFDGTAAPMIYSITGQISCVVPYEVAGRRTTQVQVESNGVYSAPLTVNVTDTAPGLFSVNSSGSGQGAILNEDGTLNSSTNAAPRGSVVVVYGTGEGATTPRVPDGKLAGDPLPRPIVPVVARIGNLDAEVLYFGGAPGLVAGVFQANVRIPDTAPTGAAVPIAIQVGVAASPLGITLAIR